MSRFDASVPRSMAPWDVPGDLSGSRVERLEKRATRVCACAWRTPSPFPVCDLFSVFVLFALEEKKIMQGVERGNV